jgi:hypothetical protein
MEDRIQEDVAPADLAQLRRPAHPGDSLRAARQQLRREVPQRADHARLDQLDLAEQVALACLDLDRLGVTVPRGPALQHVGDEHLPALQADLFQQLVEQLAGASYERLALLVLVEARRLADEHQVCVRVAGAEHDVRAALGQRALRAVGELVVERDQLVAPGGRVSGSHRHHRSILRSARCRPATSRGRGRRRRWTPSER